MTDGHTGSSRPSIFSQEEHDLLQQQIALRMMEAFDEGAREGFSWGRAEGIAEGLCIAALVLTVGVAIVALIWGRL